MVVDPKHSANTRFINDATPTRKRNLCMDHRKKMENRGRLR